MQPCNESKLGVVHCMLPFPCSPLFGGVLRAEGMIACQACSANIATALDASNDASIDITSQDCMLFRITYFSISATSNIRLSLATAGTGSCVMLVQPVPSCAKPELAGRPTQVICR